MAYDTVIYIYNKLKKLIQYNKKLAHLVLVTNVYFGNFVYFAVEEDEEPVSNFSPMLQLVKCAFAG